MPGRDQAAGPAFDLLTLALEEAVGGLRRIQVADPFEDAAIGDPGLGEGDGGGHKVAAGHLVDNAHRPGVFGTHRIAGEDDPQRLFRPDQARQALGAAGAGNKPQFHLRQGELGRRGGDAEMTPQGQLEPAAEGDAVDGGDDWF